MHIDRRDFLRAALTLSASVALPNGAQAGNNKETAIGVFAEGGMSSINSFDYKPNAPKEIRGDTGKANYGETGVVFSPYFPHLARLSGKMAVIRSMVSTSLSHKEADDEAVIEGGKGLAGRLGRLRSGGIPYLYGELPGADLNTIYRTPHKPELITEWDGKNFIPPKIEKANAQELHSRRDLLKKLDSLQIDKTTQEALFQQRECAYDLLSGSMEAFNLPQDELKRYGNTAPGKAMLLSRRLAEMGKARSIVFRTTDWDFHNDLHRRMEKPAMELDQAIAALLEDMGKKWEGLFWMRTEFGRQSVLNSSGGREHSPVSSAILAGKRIKPGVIGETSSLLETKGPSVQPKDFQKILLEAMGSPPEFGNQVTSLLIKR